MPTNNRGCCEEAAYERGGGGNQWLWRPAQNAGDGGGPGGMAVGAARRGAVPYLGSAADTSVTDDADGETGSQTGEADGQASAEVDEAAAREGKKDAHEKEDKRRKEQSTRRKEG